MALVDSLLKLVTMQNADALVVVSGQVPYLERKGERVALSMPVPSPDVIDGILCEVANADERNQLRSEGMLLKTHRCADESCFALQAERDGDGVQLVFRPGALARQGAARPTSQAEEPSAPTNFPPSTTTTAAAPTTTATEGGSQVDTALAEVAPHVASLLVRAQTRGASDLLVSSAADARLRIGGQLCVLEDSRVAEAQLTALTTHALGEVGAQTLVRRGSCDFAVDGPGGNGRLRYRVNVFRQQHGLAAAFRPIRHDAPTLEQLNLPGHLNELTRFGSGLVLVVGPAGSGKSTTLVALIEQLNRSSAKHVITLEEPIEYVYEPRRCLIHQRELGAHVPDFATGLRAALRESPDVILLGEMRDRETIAAALTAAETGHLVLSTLHSASASMAVHRMVDVFAEHQQRQVLHQLADVLRAVVTQILLPSSQAPRRVPAYEKLMVTAAVSTKIRDNRCHQLETELQKGRAEGMVPLERSLAELVQRSLLDAPQARHAARDPELLDQMLRGRI